MDTKTRSITKSLTWRILGIIILWLLALLLTGDIKQSTILSLLFHLIRFTLYYFHERIWDKIYWGKISKEGLTIWFTGLPCSGKSTIADLLANNLRGKGLRVVRLDGDVLRESPLCDDLGFSKEDRDKNIDRVIWLCKILSEGGAIVIPSFVSPYRDKRMEARKEIKNFVEVFVDCSLEECMRKDTKGMYKKAKEGKIKDFTGVSDPYETPIDEEIYLNTEVYSLEYCVEKVINGLKGEGLI